MPIYIDETPECAERRGVEATRESARSWIAQASDGPSPIASCKELFHRTQSHMESTRLRVCWRAHRRRGRKACRDFAGTSRLAAYRYQSLGRLPHGSRISQPLDSRRRDARRDVKHHFDSCLSASAGAYHRSRIAQKRRPFLRRSRHNAHPRTVATCDAYLRGAAMAQVKARICWKSAVGMGCLIG